MSNKFISKNARDDVHFVSNDLCHLAEVLHPKNIDLGYNSFSLCHATINKGEKSIPHYLKTSSEIYYVTSGNGTLHINDEEIKLKAHSVAVVPPSAVQYLVNDGECEIEFICMVTPPWSEEDEVIC